MAEFKSRGFRIHFVEQGRGPAVVFAHGFLLDHTMFAPQFEDLPDDYRCLAWDMRGHGDSEDPVGPWSVQDIAVDLIAFIEDLNAAPCHLVGHSLGGMAALRIALQREDLVRSLVLADVSAGAEHPERASYYRSLQQVAERDGVTEELARSTLGICFGPRYLQTELEGAAIHMARVMDLEPRVVVEGFRALIDRESVTDRLGEVRVPTLVIHGEDDSAVGLHDAQMLREGIRGAELVTVPAAGHTPPWEAPDPVNEALAIFLRRVLGT